MKFKNFLLCIAGFLLACYACSKDEVQDEGNTGSPVITIPESENSAPVFTTAGGSITLNFKATADWSATFANTRADSWISVQPSSGAAGNITITITTAGNDSFDDRNATIQLICGNDVKTITVTQKQKNALTLTTARYEVKQQGDIIKAEVKANISFSVEIPDAYKSWITQQFPTRALGSSTLTFKIEPNLETTLREGEIIVRETGGTLTETLKVYQTGGDIIIISQRNYVVASSGETIGVEIKSNVENYDVTLPQVNWISENSTRSVSTNTLYYTITPNETYEPREAKIIYSSGTTADTVTIRQVQKGALAIAQDKFDIAGTGGQFSVKLSTNEKFDVEIPVSATWIHQITTRSLENHTLNFSVDTNTTTEPRSAVIKIKSETQTGSITVKQAGHSEVSFSSDTIHVSSAATAKEFSLTANTAWTLKSNNENWCTVSPVQGNKGTYTIRVSITENTSMLETRKTTLTAKIDSITWNIAVIQDRKEPDPNINKGIRTLDDLINFRDAVNAGKDISEWKYNGEINLLADIDLSYVENWEPIGYWRSEWNKNPFTGIFNGNGYAIKNLKINSNARTVGFFGYNSGIIKNVNLKEADITGSYPSTNRYPGYVGGICAWNFISDGNANGKITNCIISGKITGNNNTTQCGGICGENDNRGTISNCINNSVISGQNIGGICGYNSSGSSITSCINNGIVLKKADQSIYHNNYGTISDCIDNGCFDPDFYNVLVKQGISTVEQIQTITSLNCYDKRLSSLNGIQYFTALQTLNCGGNYLTTISNIEKCKNLTKLLCHDNSLKTLELNQTKLKELNCSYCKLISLKVNPELKKLQCTNNNLTNLDVKQYPILTYLNCSNNQLDNIDLTKNTLLTFLNCNGTQINKLDVSSCSLLDTIYCSNNNISDIDVSSCKNLKVFTYKGNPLHEIKLGKAPIKIFELRGSSTTSGEFRISGDFLQELNCSSKNLTKIDIKDCPDLNIIDCSDNEINELYINQNQKLNKINCSRNPLTKLDISNNHSLRDINCSRTLITTLDLTNCSQLKSLDYSYNNLTALNLTNSNLLETLNCSFNKLTTLDLTNCRLLKSLDCSYNNLTALNLTNYSLLETLNCSSNKLTTLDVSRNLHLNGIICSGNPLELLNVDNGLIETIEGHTLTNLKIIGKTLKKVDLYESTGLKKIDIDECPALEFLNVGACNLIDLNVRNNTLLTYLNCADNLLTSLNLSTNLALREVNCGENHLLTEVLLKKNQVVEINTGHDVIIKYVE